MQVGNTTFDTVPTCSSGLSGDMSGCDVRATTLPGSPTERIIAPAE